MAKIEVEVDKIKSLTVFSVTGDLKQGELLEKLEKYVQSPNCKYCIIDLSQGSWINIPVDYFRRVLENRELFEHSEGKSALVFGNDADFGIGRMIESMLSLNDYGREVGCFRSREKADKWIMQD